MHTKPLELTSAKWRACFIFALAGCTTLGRAALWESRDWALAGTITGTVGYDSNLTLIRNGPEDTFVQAKPQFTLSRRNSGTDLHADAWVSQTEFVKGRQPSQTDLFVGATYAYPFAEKVVPVYKSSLSWQRTSDPDQYLGQRIQHDRTSFSAEGFVSLSGKLGLRGEADAYMDEFDSESLNNNKRVRVFAGLAYEKRPGLEASVNIGGAEGRSEPNRVNVWGMTDSVRSSEIYLTARLRGEITPKISGSIYGGMGRVVYKGGFSNSYNLPVAGADLTWGLDPRRTLVLAAYSGADYAPDGQTVETSRAFLSFTHVIVGRWQYILRGGPTHTIFRNTAFSSTDDALEGGVEFAYTPSDRFRIAAGILLGWHDSDIRERQYNRSTYSINSTYRF